MWQLVASIAAAVGLVVGAFTVGSKAGHGTGYTKGEAAGSATATTLLTATHRAAIDELNRKAAEAQLTAVLAEQERHETERKRIDEARHEAIIEIARIGSDRDALAARVRGALTRTCARGNPGRDDPVPGAAAVPAGDATATPGRLLLDRVGADLTDHASRADTTLAQYTICYRMLRRAGGTESRGREEARR